MAFGRTRYAADKAFAGAMRENAYESQYRIRQAFLRHDIFQRSVFSFELMTIYERRNIP